MNDLDRLRRRIARIDRKWSNPATAAAAERRFWQSRSQTPLAAGQGIEELLTGEVLQISSGACFRAFRSAAFHKRHGNADISALSEMSGAAIGFAPPPTRWAFLDTETTGLAGGTGTYCFLIGIGWIEGRDFHVQQYLMRDYAEEPALLDAVAAHLARFDVVVTYNGKTFDVPLLETRYRMCRRKPALERLEHFDLLHSARRLFRLRLSSCRLVELESSVLGFLREGDLPGEMIPYYYFDYLRTHNALKLVPIFHHNWMDILTLACLASLVLAAVGEPESVPLAHPLDIYSLGAWVAKVGKRASAVRLYERALAAGLPDVVDWRARAELALLHKRARAWDRALPLWTALADAPNGFRLAALEELAKYYEHRARDYARALEVTRAAVEASADGALWQRRVARLERRIGRSPLFRIAEA